MGHLITPFVLCFSSIAWPHAEAPSFSGLTGSTIFNNPTNAYGWISSSESEATRANQFYCDIAHIRDYVDSALFSGEALAAHADDASFCPLESTIPTRRRELERFTHDNLGALAYNRMASSVVELDLLTALALDPARPPNLPALSCRNDLIETGTLDRVLANSSSFPSHDLNSTNNYSAGAVTSSSGARADDREKYHGVLNQYALANVLRATLVSEQLARMRSRLGCPRTGGNYDCRDLARRENRVHQSFPALFEADGAGDRENIMDAMRELAGALDNPSRSAETARLAGENYLDAALDENMGHESLLLRLDQALNSTAPGMSTHIANLHDSLNQFRQRSLERARNQWNRICDPERGFTMNEMLVMEPDAVRQAMLDGPDYMRDTLRASMCANPATRNLVEEPDNDCEGVTREPIEGTSNFRTTVNRRRGRYPYSSQNVLTIEEVSDVATVNLTVHFIAGPGVTPEALRPVVDRWITAGNSYFNCQTGGLGRPDATTIINPDGTSRRFVCPTDGEMRDSRPAVRFRINAEIHSSDSSSIPEPKVTVSECFRSEISSTDCAAVRNFQLEQCVRAGSTEASCESSTPEGRECARENAGNYTLNTESSTVLHEFGHLMGMDDEYADPTFSFTELGEHNSLMRDQRAPNARLYPRHRLRIISPISCRPED